MGAERAAEQSSCGGTDVCKLSLDGCQTRAGWLRSSTRRVSGGRRLESECWRGQLYGEHGTGSGDVAQSLGLPNVQRVRLQSDWLWAVDRQLSAGSGRLGGARRRIGRDARLEAHDSRHAAELTTTVLHRQTGDAW